jgi:hypothetical protein
MALGDGLAFRKRPLHAFHTMRVGVFLGSQTGNLLEKVMKIPRTHLESLGELI